MEDWRRLGFPSESAYRVWKRENASEARRARLFLFVTGVLVVVGFVLWLRT